MATHRTTIHWTHVFSTSTKDLQMTRSPFKRHPVAAPLLAALLLASPWASAKDTVKIAFIGPLTGGVSANGIGGRNSADLAVKLRNEDPKAKYKFELVVLDDECKPNVGVQVATKVAADNSIVAGVTHYCSAVAMSHGGRLSQVRHAGDRVGRGAARHHLRQRLQGDPPRQRHDDQPERGGGRSS